MAKPNYSFEKRQRELAKKRKKEEKAQRRAAATENKGQGDGAPAEPGATPEAPPQQDPPA